MTALRAIYKPSIYTFAALLSALVVWCSYKVDPQFMVLYGLAFGTGFVVGRQTKGAVKERWMELCELAANEQDSQKLLALVKEINRLLEEKVQRLKAHAAADQASTKY